MRVSVSFFSRWALRVRRDLRRALDSLEGAEVEKAEEEEGRREEEAVGT